MRNIGQMLIKTAVKLCVIFAALFLCLGICRGLFNMVNWECIGEHITKVYGELKEEEKSFAKGKNTVTNALGEVYTVKYRETHGFPDHGMRVEISSGELTLIKYSLDFERSCVPERILFLFREGSVDYYYAGNMYDGLFSYDRLTRKGKRLYFYKKPKSGSACDNNMELSRTFQRNIKRSELTEKFKLCGYDDTYILAVYDYLN